MVWMENRQSSRWRTDVTQNSTGLYLDLMKKVLTNPIYEDPPIMVYPYSDTDHEDNPRYDGRDWPSVAHTMVGLRRLDNLQYCVEPDRRQRARRPHRDRGMAWRVHYGSRWVCHRR